MEPEHKNYLHYAYNSSVQDLSISLQPHYGPQDVYAGSVDNRDLPQGAGSIYAQVSRRLVYTKNKTIQVVEGHRILALFWVTKLGFLISNKCQLRFWGQHWTSYANWIFPATDGSQGVTPSRVLEWWFNQDNLMMGRPFFQLEPTMSIVTDASKDWVVSGKWSAALTKHHINWLELQAVWLAMELFLPQMGSVAVDVLSNGLPTSTRRAVRSNLSYAN